MRSFANGQSLIRFCAILFIQFSAFAADTFSVATFNLENYLDSPIGSRPVKSQAAKEMIRECIRRINPDVIALQEVGNLSALLELRDSLRSEAMIYRDWEFVSGYDTNIHIAVLSKFPIVARRSHTNENFLLYGRRFKVSRGFSEIDIRISPRYSFTLISAHLKSRRPVSIADEKDLREEEARMLREKIDAVLAADPDANLIVAGDFNDVKSSPSTKLVIGRGKRALIDTRPAEQNGDEGRNGARRGEPRRVTWTYHYGTEDTYSRIDYILLSRGMSREWNPAGTYVLAMSNWGVASDHRPIVVQFHAVDR